MTVGLRRGGQTFEKANADPSAGVPLVRRVYCCPRCGVVKGFASEVRRTICADCRDVLSAAERLAWREAA